jgi:putative phosphoribosyl transferase
MIFHRDREALFACLAGRALGDSPAFERSSIFEPEVPVKVRGKVLVHDEDALLSGLSDATGGLGRSFEIAGYYRYMFRDRIEAGVKLAKALGKFKGRKLLILALPRGGVPVGFEIAKALGCPLDTIVARKVGAPGNPEYAMGAIAPGVQLLEEEVEGIEEVVASEKQEMKRRMEKYKSGSYAAGIQPEVVILVDDGIATGKSAVAALRSARAAYSEAKLVFAAPVGAPDALMRLQSEADEIVCLEAPPEFMAVGEWYISFPQLADEEVVRYLKKAAQIRSHM